MALRGTCGMTADTCRTMVSIPSGARSAMDGSDDEDDNDDVEGEGECVWGSEMDRGETETG